MKELKSILILAALLMLVLTACSNNSNSSKTASETDKKTFTVGTSPGPYSELFLNEIKPILEKKGYTIETIVFSDLLAADIAITEGKVDLNVDQHTAYMNNFNKERGESLTSLTPIPTVPAGIFPGRKSSLKDVAKGDAIGIPKDPSNAARAYALLQKAKLIKLKDGIELVKATANDIVENPNNLEIIEMDSSQIPRSLVDLDYGIIPGSVVYSSKLDASTVLLSEDVLKDLELVAVVDKANKDSQWAKDVIAAYQSDELKAYLKKNNKDGYWFIPKELK